jgi:hypothetical protein
MLLSLIATIERAVQAAEEKAGQVAAGMTHPSSTSTNTIWQTRAVAATYLVNYS